MLLRKLKRGFCKKKTMEESRVLNRQFQEDPGRVYDVFNGMLKNTGDQASERPKYKTRNDISVENKQVFESIEEASGYWKELWETEGTGDKSATWLQEVKRAIHGCVPPPDEGEWGLTEDEAVKIVGKKRNWSAPGPDKLVNYWWKKAEVLHNDVTASFRAISMDQTDFPIWFVGGKTSLIPKPGEFSSDNQRPITCLNTVYKWFTACLLVPVDNHLEEHGLMEAEQRGAKNGCSGTMDNLLIDQMVTQDCQHGKRNLSMAWVDVTKAYDTVDHDWLCEMMEVHRFPRWLGGVVTKLCSTRNTKIITTTKLGKEISETIQFKRGLPQGDSLCPRLFTICLNPIAWSLKATEEYRLSKPLSTKVTDLRYIDDLKIYAASENTVLRSTRGKMQDSGLQWNPKKCSVVHVKKGVKVEDVEGVKFDEASVIRCLKRQAVQVFLEYWKHRDNRINWPLRLPQRSV